MPGESAWPTSYDYNWCENTAQGQTKTGPQVSMALWVSTITVQGMQA